MHARFAMCRQLPAPALKLPAAPGFINLAEEDDYDADMDADEAEPAAAAPAAPAAQPPVTAVVLQPASQPGPAVQVRPH